MKHYITINKKYRNESTALERSVIYLWDVLGRAEQTLYRIPTLGGSFGCASDWRPGGGGYYISNNIQDHFCYRSLIMADAPHIQNVHDNVHNKQWRYVT